MSGSDTQWNVIRCEHCDGLMKVPATGDAGSVACPSCGATSGGNADAEEVLVDPTTGVEPEPVSENLDLAQELEPIPDIHKPGALDAAADSIPAPRREDYKVPEMISNVGDRSWTPKRDAPDAPKIDASRMGSTSDERLAPDEVEEGAVQIHVARKVTGWDIDEKDLAAPTERDGAVESAKSKILLVTIAIVTVVLLGVVAFGLLRVLTGDDTPGIVAEKAEGEVARESLTGVERLVLDHNKETFAAAGARVEEFLSASNYRERLPLVRDPERVEPLMEAYYRDNPDGPIDFRKPPDRWNFRLSSRYLLTDVVDTEYNNQKIAVEVDDDGSFLIDWESFVGYCEVPLAELVKTPPPGEVLVRVEASIGDYYNYGYKDNEWACIQMEDKARSNVIYGYVALSDPLLNDLKKVMTIRGASHATLRIEHAGEGKAANQFLIKEVVASGWVFSDDNIITRDTTGDGG